MTIDLPEDLQRYVHDQVLAGRFRTEDEVILDAVEHHRHTHPITAASPVTTDPVLGSMREDAEFLDEIVDRAMKARREQPWRISPIE
jgi:Arc/MetJ-type ribon-helix-helix transcriptional regulator